MNDPFWDTPPFCETSDMTISGKKKGVAFDRYRFGGEMGFDVVDQDFKAVAQTIFEYQ